MVVVIGIALMGTTHATAGDRSEPQVIVITPVDWNAKSGLLVKILGEKLGNTQFSLLTPVTTPLGSEGSGWYHHSPHVRITGTDAQPTLSCTGLIPSKSQIYSVLDFFKPEGCKNQLGKCWRFDVTFASITNDQYACKIGVEDQEITFQVKVNPIAPIFSTCGQGFYYTDMLNPDSFELKNIEQCNNCIKGIKTGSDYFCGLPSWATSEKIINSYVCSQGYPIPENPCPTGFVLNSDFGLTGEKVVGKPSPVYGCTKVENPTVDQNGYYKGACSGQFHSDDGGGGWLACMDNSAHINGDPDKDYTSEFKQCEKDNYKYIPYFTPANSANLAVKACCKGKMELTFWCYADKPVSNNQCGTGGAKLIGEGTPMLGFEQGACCVFTEKK